MLLGRALARSPSCSSSSSPSVASLVASAARAGGGRAPLAPAIALPNFLAPRIAAAGVFGSRSLPNIVPHRGMQMLNTDPDFDIFNTKPTVENVVQAVRTYVREGGDMPPDLVAMAARDPRLPLYIKLMRQELRRGGAGAIATEDYPPESLPCEAIETFVPEKIRMVMGARRKMIRRDQNRRALFAKYEITRKYLKSIAVDERLPYVLRVRAKIAMHRLPLNSSHSRLHRFCPFSGRSKGLVYPLFISRIMFRRFFDLGLMYPFQKALW